MAGIRGREWSGLLRLSGNSEITPYDVVEFVSLIVFSIGHMTSLERSQKLIVMP